VVALTLWRPLLPYARMSKITNDGSARSGTGCFIAVHMWQQWASERARSLCSIGFRAMAFRTSDPSS